VATPPRPLRVRRGHVYKHRSWPFRLVVVSDDLHNANPYTHRVLAMPITRTAVNDAGAEVPFTVNLESSTVRGYVRVAEQIPVNPADLIEPETDELLSGADLDNVKRVHDEFLGYY
jgi:hypothetical protein